MNLKYIFAAACVVLAGCSGVDYTGAEYPSSISTRIFYDSQLVPQEDYVKIGSAEITAYAGDKSIDINNQLIAKGKAVGADVILVTSEKTLAEEAVEPATDAKKTAKPAFVKRVAVYTAETVIRACFFKKKTSIEQFNEDEKYTAEDKENPNIVYIDENQQKKLLEEKKKYNESQESKDKLPGTLGSPEEAQKEFNKEFNPENLNDPVYNEFKNVPDGNHAPKVEPLKNPSKLYAVPDNEQKKYDAEYKKIMDGTITTSPDNPENTPQPNLKQVDKDIDKLIQNINVPTETEQLKDVEDNIK